METDDNQRLKDLMAVDPELMDKDLEKELFKEIKKSRFLLPVEFTFTGLDPAKLEEGQTITLDEPMRFALLTIKNDGKVLLPLFTDEEAMEVMGKVSVISHHAQDIASLLMNGEEIDEIVINPNTESSIGMPAEAFVFNCIGKEIENVFRLEEDIKEYGVPLEEDMLLYLRSETPFMAEQAEDGIFTSFVPFKASSQDVCNTDFKYLNLLMVPKGTVFLYVGNIIDDVTKNNDLLLASTISFRLLEEHENTFTWQCIEQKME